MTPQFTAAIDLADVLDATCDDRGAEESTILLAACLLVSRRIARIAPCPEIVRDAAIAASAQIGTMAFLEYQKKLLLGVGET
jgi:hypothetical protein